MAVHFGLRYTQALRIPFSGLRTTAQLAAAALHMVRRMQGELWDYLAIPTTSDGGQTLALNRDAEVQRQAMAAATVRLSERDPDPAWLRARTRMVNFIDSFNTVWIETSQIPPPFVDPTPLIGFAYLPGIANGAMVVNPFTWWVPEGGGTDVMTGTPQALAMMSPTMMLLHEIAHESGALNPNSGVGDPTAHVFDSRSEEREDAAVRDVDLSMTAHHDVGRRGWYGDTSLLVGGGERGHYAQNQPGQYFFMGEQSQAVQFGDRLMRGEVQPEQWTGNWLRYPDRDTLLWGRAPTRPRPGGPTQPGAVTEGPAAALPAPVPAERPVPQSGARGRLTRTAASPAAVLTVQRAAGNRAVTRLLDTGASVALAQAALRHTSAAAVSGAQRASADRTATSKSGVSMA